MGDDGGTPARARKVAEVRRHFAPLPLAQVLPGITRATYRQRSPAGAVVMSEWAAIVGPRLAAETEPRRLTRGVLTVVCAGPVAMELQYLAPALIERINTFAGAAVVQSIRFAQGQVARPAASLPDRSHVAPLPVEGVAPGELHQSLGRLLAVIRSRDAEGVP